MTEKRWAAGTSFFLSFFTLSVFGIKKMMAVYIYILYKKTEKYILYMWTCSKEGGKWYTGDGRYKYILSQGVEKMIYPLEEKKLEQFGGFVFFF